MATQSICKIDGCGKNVHYNGLCSAHAERQRQHGDPLLGGRRPKPTCGLDGCDLPHKGMGYCQKHLMRFKKYGSPTGRRPRNDDFECSVEGCDRAVRASGLCEMHYQRKRAHGTELGHVPPKTPSGEAERFYRDVVQSYEGDDCLIWPFARSYGYGRLGQRTVSRLVCEETHGAPPGPESEAAHSCGNGHLGCVAKRHVEWKSPKENVADQLIHGTRPRGERRWNAKLTEKDVREIRNLIGKESHSAIAKRYRVNASTISFIKSGRVWGWLE